MPEDEFTPLGVENEPPEGTNAGLRTGGPEAPSNLTWFREHYSGMPIPSYLWRCVDDDFVLLDFNEAAAEITCGKIAGYVGVHASQFYADLPEIIESLRRCATEKTVGRRDMYYKFRSTGEEKFLAVVFVFLNPDLIMVHTEDITGRKKAEENLRESEEKYRTLVEMSPQAIAIVQDRRFAFANQAAARLLGFDRAEDIIGVDAMAPVPSSEVKRLTGYLERMLAGDPTVPHYSREAVLRRNGCPIEIDLYATEVTFRGRPAIQMVATDVTEREKDAEALRESEEKYRTLVEISPHTIAIFQDHKVAFVNQAAARLLGFDRVEDLIGVDVMAPAQAEDVKRLEDYLEKHTLHPDSTPDKFTFRGNRREGSSFTAEIFITGITFKGRPAAQLMAVDITEREKSQQALRDSEEKYRNLVETFPQAIAIVQDKMIVFANRAAVAMFGYKGVKNMPGIDVFRHIAPEERERLDSFYERRIRGDTNVPSQYFSLMTRRNGEVFPVEVFASRIEFRGRPAIQLAVIDITERLLAEAALRESEERFRAIGENSPIGICLNDRDGVYHYVNKAYCEIYGYTKEELLGRSFFDMIMPPGHLADDRARYARYFDKPVVTPLRETDIFVRKDGRPVIVQYTSEFIRQDDAVRYMVSMNIDVTDKRRAQDELRESEEKYRLLFESAAEVFATINQDGEFILVNKAAARYLGGSPDDFVGRKLSEVFTGEQAARFLQSVRRVISNGRAISTEGDVLLPGGPRWFKNTVQPIVGLDGQIQSAMLISVDITAEKRAQIRNEARYRLVEKLRRTRDVDQCLTLCCQAIGEAQLFKRAVLTIHDQDRAIMYLGQIGLDDAVVMAARAAPAPDRALSERITQEKYRIGHSFFVPVEDGLFGNGLGRVIPQEGPVVAGDHFWRPGDEFFVPLVGSDGANEGWLSVDSPVDGMRPTVDTATYLEEIIDVTAKQVREIQGLKKLEREQAALQEKNIALREVLAHIDEDKMEFRQIIGATVNQVLLPALNKLIRKDGTINFTYYNILRSGLPDLVATSGAVVHMYIKLSPRERQICDMVKSGTSSKEIAAALSISLATVRKHRELIRKKLGISNTKISLSNYLRGNR
jgi:PAS domain S-box-containing protein